MVAVPTVVFYDDKDAGRPLVRFAFCKRDEVIDEAAAARLAATDLLDSVAVSGTVVMKFGGTSVADAERIKRAARRIVRAREQAPAASSPCCRRAARRPTS